MYINSYECPCGTTWDDEWDCMCDDRCPVCNTSCEPVSSEETEKDGPKKMYWTQPIPTGEKPVSSPSEKARLKTRAKRKAKKNAKR